jgi:hypothetical protein
MLIKRTVLLLGLFLVVCSATSARADELARNRMLEAYGKLPSSFETNNGQFEPEVKFASRFINYNLFLYSNKASFSFNSSGSHLDMRLIGANSDSRAVGVDQLSGKSNYIAGSDPKMWRSGITNFSKVRFEDIYPGIDIVYYGNKRQLEFDLFVRPGSDPSLIAISFDRAEKISVDKKGDLVLSITGEEFRLHKPIVYQEVDGVRNSVSGRYLIKSGNKIGFELGKYDSKKALVIDPVMLYSSRFGSSGLSDSVGIAVDKEGNAYVTGKVSYEGYNTAPDFPMTPDSYKSSFGGLYDIYVTKLNPSGTEMIYSTYLGGNNYEEVGGIAVDDEGNAYITGYTASPDFPTTPNAYQNSWIDTVTAAFVTKLNSTGTALVYSTLLGGKDELDSTGRPVGGVADIATSIAVDREGNAYVGGYTFSKTFPVTANAFQSSMSGNCVSPRCNDGFVTKLNSDGSDIVYSTYLGGGDQDKPASIAVDEAGNVFLTGDTTSTNFPTTSGAFQIAFTPSGSFINPSEVFITKLNTTGTALVYSTFLGGKSGDSAYDIAIDTAGNAYVSGSTTSTDFPTTASSFRPTYDGSSPNVYVTKLNATGSTLVYSTFLGSTYIGKRTGIAVDSAGNAYVTGQTASIRFPVTKNATQRAFNKIIDAFVTKLNADGSALVFSTYLGGEGMDTGSDIAIGPNGEAYVTGSASFNFPATAGSIEIAPGFTSTFVVKYEIGAAVIPKITGASIKGKKLLVFGEDFDDGAIIFINGKPQPTKNDLEQPDTTLVGKKTAKKVLSNLPAKLQVRNSDGNLSAEFIYTGQ